MVRNQDGQIGLYARPVANVFATTNITALANSGGVVRPITSANWRSNVLPPQDNWVGFHEAGAKLDVISSLDTEDHVGSVEVFLTIQKRGWR